jgi:hypothetical protein
MTPNPIWDREQPHAAAVAHASSDASRLVCGFADDGAFPIVGFWSKLFAIGCVLLLLSPAVASGKPVRLDCTLRDVETRTSSNFDRAAGGENRPVSLMFDEQSNALTLYQDGKSRALHDVTITQLAVSGADDMISLGVDRSSLSMVLQSYGPDSMRAELGICTVGLAPE